MISRTHRFHGHNSLSYVYRNGKNVRGPLMATRYVRNDRRTSYRVAVVVSKKVSKSAVVRNRIRRRIYETVRLLEPKMLTPYDIVITVFTDTIADMPYAELQRAVFSQLRSAGAFDAS